MEKNSCSCVLVVVMSSMAGAMAWGIRGQYGHERGAMVAGVLVGLTVTLLLASRLAAIQAARAVALFALGISIGGCMTYGQTVGLTQDGPLVGNSEAFRWGMLGLAVKGGIWIGLGTAFLGIGLSGVRYRPLETGLLVVAMFVAMLIGVQLLNRPYGPADKLLPTLYFSDHWYWEPDVDSPRRESWGGLLFALILLVAYTGVKKRDRLAVHLALWGVIGGAIGFPLGQAVQATYAWYPEWMAELPTNVVTRYFNWWNMMETAFGATFGAIVGLGAWLNRVWIQPIHDSDGRQLRPADSVSMHPVVEWMLIGVHVALLVAWNFGDDRLTDYLDAYAEQALLMILIPVMGVLAGRFWPFAMALPVVVIPIAGKTLDMLTYRVAEAKVAPMLGWSVYGVLPVLAGLSVAVYFASPSRAYLPSRRFSGWSLITAAWIYFCLNFAYFDMPWPWEPWGGRTPNTVIFAVCLTALTCVCWRALQAEESSADSSECVPRH